METQSWCAPNVVEFAMKKMHRIATAGQRWTEVAQMNRAERRALGVPKTVASNIEEAEKRRTVNTYSVAVASVLWDSGMSKDDVHAILGKILDRFDTIKKDYATMEDYRIMLREEAGIEIKYC